jgi:hypothetical protein
MGDGGFPPSPAHLFKQILAAFFLLCLMHTRTCVRIASIYRTSIVVVTATHPIWRIVTTCRRVTNVVCTGVAVIAIERRGCGTLPRARITCPGDSITDIVIFLASYRRNKVAS